MILHHGAFDMKGLLKAATVVGFPVYGAGHVYTGHANFHLHDDTLQDSVTDSKFAQLLARNCCLRAPDFPPPAIAEELDYVNNYFKVHRWHLIVVDTWRPWCYMCSKSGGSLTKSGVTGKAGKARCQLLILSYPHLAPFLTLPTFATCGVG